ncbi:MAG TPA: putative baseplate assembly protein [Stellaceae bacterium]|jgi:predicted phage baseplate assembly protein|nr:putative baseplate assembly protein [Stellaceae bacterium]
MPIQSPQLDDLRYDAVVEQLLRRIPVYTPEWTDWNDSDPGVTLIQLFATLAEQVGYRLNQVPEKNYIELLKLLGVRLHAALAAASRIGVFLSDPTVVEGFTIDARSRFITKGSPPIIFESDADIDMVPAEPAVLVATRNPYLWDLLRLDDTGGREAVPTDAQLPKQIPAADCRWLTVAWDGKKPAGKDMPLAPIVLLPTSASGVAHPYLWVGIKCNIARDAGIAGVGVTLTVQLDDDEQPDPRADILCAPIATAGEMQPPPIDWLAYWDADQQAMMPVSGRIDDATNKLTRSGTLRFTVPFSIGAMPSPLFANLRDAIVPTPLDACTDMAQNLRNSIVPGSGAIDPAQFQQLLTTALTKAQAAKGQAKPAVGHPLDPALHDDAKILCWLRLGPLDTTPPSPRLRYLGFNVVPVTNVVTVASELIGTADGRPGQTFQLAHGNIMAGTLEVGIQESADPGALLTTWTEIASLDGTGPNDRVFELDPEAGVLTFGDGRHGRVPPLVAAAGAVVAVRYRWGGGVAGETDTGTITVSGVQFNGLAAVTNFVAARGGRDAETLDMAKLRARKELSTRDRAVTAGDFEWIALQTPNVRVRRAIIVPRRRPLASDASAYQRRMCAPPPYNATTTLSGAACGPSGTTMLTPPWVKPGAGTAILHSTITVADCGPPLPDAPAGLDDDFEAPGVVSVVVVPDGPQPPPAVRPPLVELVPTPSFLRAVCQQLDQHRLVTTEVHVVPPQYFRLCRVYCRVKARVGYTRLQLRDSVGNTLATFLDVLLGGEDGLGAPFGGQVHIADLIGRVLRTEGVERVDEMTAHFVRTKSNAPFREGNLLLCPVAADDYDHVDLAPEETTSIDLSTFTLDTV